MARAGVIFGAWNWRVLIGERALVQRSRAAVRK